MIADDTIVAFSSPPTPSARIIIRLSGRQSFQCVAALSPALPASQQVPGIARILIQTHGVQFPAWLYLFRAPRSYTGEDVVELHLPGNVILARWTMQELVRLGARPAEPGEFTARAYFNARMDLSEAEAVAAVIAANNTRQLQAARQLLAGELARRLNPIMDQLAQTLALTEVAIDFSDEDITVLSHDQTRQSIDELNARLESLLSDSTRFAQLNHEPRIVLAGRPNAGKSTLLNALSGQRRAVVSHVAGTTRDLLSAQINLPDGQVILIDAAGIDHDADSVSHVAAPDQSPIPAAMRRLALAAIAQADVLLLIHDAADPRPLLSLPRTADLVIHTKADLHTMSHPRTENTLLVSAHTGQGMDDLRRRLNTVAFGQSHGGHTIALNDRHLEAIAESRSALSRAWDAIPAGGELVALELREALNALGTILGATAPDELLGRIFSAFCIGK